MLIHHHIANTRQQVTIILSMCVRLIAKKVDIKCQILAQNSFSEVGGVVGLTRLNVLSKIFLILLYGTVNFNIIKRSLHWWADCSLADKGSTRCHFTWMKKYFIGVAVGSPFKGVGWRVITASHFKNRINDGAQEEKLAYTSSCQFFLFFKKHTPTNCLCCLSSFEAQTTSKTLILKCNIKLFQGCSVDSCLWSTWRASLQRRKTARTAAFQLYSSLSLKGKKID